MPDHDACPGCGGKLRELGEDVAEMLEYVRACFKVDERPHSSLGYRTPAEFRQALGYAEVETASRFPLPHSLGGDETISTTNLNQRIAVMNG
jgi:hypothetical protein